MTTDPAWAMSIFSVTGEWSANLSKAQSKTGFGAARSRMVVHQIDQMAVIRSHGKLQYGARWICGSGSVDVVLIADPNSHGGLCDLCEDIAQGPVVYRCFDVDGQLLYVGSSGRGSLVRLRFHEKNANWWCLVDRVTTERFSSVAGARLAETRAITTEEPVHNKLGRKRRKAA